MTFDWGKAHEVLYGYPAGSEEPLETKVVARAVDDFVEDLLKRGNAIIRQAAYEANKAGLPVEGIPYFYFLLDEQSENWPQMHPMKRQGLDLVASILKESGKMPPYSRVMSILPPSSERSVHLALDNLGTWGAT